MPAEDPLFLPSLAAADTAFTSPARSANGIWLLLTMVLFALTQMGGFDWVGIAMLMGVLLVHEAGHYLGMQIFGYRDVRMFFIPFFGAAVSGKKHAAPAWQQLIVLLLGPLPGIVLGAVLYVVLQPPNFESREFYAIVMLIGLNAFNLLPLMPLDGGRVVHLLIFRRHPLLELVFRILAAAALGLLAFAMGAFILGILAVFLAIGIPLGYRQATRAREMRLAFPSARAPWPELAEPEQRELYRHAREILPGDQNPANIGARMLQLHEAVAERSPGVLATLAFLGIYFGAIMAVPILLVLMGLDMHRRNPNLQNGAPPQAQHEAARAADELGYTRFC